MSRDHFRDLYSARREGTLEPGPAAAFDSALAGDPDLHEDYEGFRAACDALDLGAKEEIVAPDWLSARILDRLETLPTATQTRAGRFSLGGLSLRSLGFAGLGAVALLGATFAVIRQNDGRVATAGVASIGDATNAGSGDVKASAGDALRPMLENGRVFIDLQPSPGTHSVSILGAPDGALLKRFRLDGQRLHSELANSQPQPYAFEVRVDREARPLLVVVPGTDRTPSPAERPIQGTGDLLLFAKTLAHAYGTPVAIHVAAPKTAVTWNLTGAQANTEAIRTLEGLGLAVDVMPGGLLSIQDR